MQLPLSLVGIVCAPPLPLTLRRHRCCCRRRNRVEHLKRHRRNWELVYQHVTRADALCTLAAIEEAAARVDAALSEESRERTSVSGAPQ